MWRDRVAGRGAREARAAKTGEVARVAGSQTHDPTAAQTLTAGEAQIAGGTWLRWSAFVQRRPWTIAIVVHR